MDSVIRTMNCVAIGVISNILADMLIHLFIIITKDPSLPTKHQDGSDPDDE